MEKSISNELEQLFDTPNIDDKVLMDLAKKRFSDKRNLLGQVIDFLLIIFTMFLQVAILDIGDAELLAVLFWLFWGVRLAVRIFKFAKPSFKDGVAAYLKERKERKIESEFNKLKK